ncbi:MAG: RodZ domain-containing protein [Betaproteobacteria bacterium]
MSTLTETPEPKDPVVARAEVIASNDPTAPDQHPSTQAATPVAPASVGALLKVGREKLGLSPGDIATKLRMGLKQVVALESSDFAALPTGTFLRGFVRNYAKAVALNADEVLVLLERTHSAAAAVKASSEVVPSQQNIKVPVPGGDLANPRARALAIGVVFLLLLGAVWYWWQYVFLARSDSGRTSASTALSVLIPSPEPSVSAGPPANALPPVSAPASTDVATTNQSVPLPATVDIAGAGLANLVQQPAVTPAVLSPPASVAPASEPARERIPPPIPGNAALGFTFSGESWVEVVDASGKTILSRRFKAGDAEEVSGRAPFVVVIGNAKSTRMAFNGREFDLDPFTRGAVARATVQ